MTPWLGVFHAAPSLVFPCICWPEGPFARSCNSFYVLYLIGKILLFLYCLVLHRYLLSFHSFTSRFWFIFFHLYFIFSIFFLFHCVHVYFSFFNPFSNFLYFSFQPPFAYVFVFPSRFSKKISGLSLTRFVSAQIKSLYILSVGILFNNLYIVSVFLLPISSLDSLGIIMPSFQSGFFLFFLYSFFQLVLTSVLFCWFRSSFGTQNLVF